MKAFLALLVFAVAGVAPGHAQWAVVDVAGLKQSVVNYSALTKQIANQAAQINNQIQQIQQFEMQMKRLGDMATVKNLVGFPEFQAELKLPTKIKSWADTLAKVDGRGLFGDTRGGIFPEISIQFPDFDGLRIERDPQVFKQSQGIVVTVDEFMTVQRDVYTRREDMKRAIALTSEAMQAATTQAEQQKLESVLNAQYGQLTSIDSEVALSAAEVQVKEAEANAMINAQNAADAEARRRLAQQEVTKITTAFKPGYECLLQYVTERPLSP